MKTIFLHETKFHFCAYYVFSFDSRNISIIRINSLCSFYILKAYFVYCLVAGRRIIWHSHLLNHLIVRRDVSEL